METKDDSTQSTANRIKERLMKDVANILEEQPAKLKPSWTGLKSGRGSAVREVGPIKDWVAYWG